MRTLQGGIGVLLVVFAFWMLPPLGDVQVLALPLHTKIMLILGHTLIASLGGIIFLRSALMETKT